MNRILPLILAASLLALLAGCSGGDTTGQAEATKDVKTPAAGEKLPPGLEGAAGAGGGGGAPATGAPAGGSAGGSGAAQAQTGA